MRSCTPAVVVASLLLLACGASAASGSGATTTARTATTGTEPMTTRAETVTRCAPAGAPVAFELVDLPQGIAATVSDGACVLTPSDAHEPPFAFVVFLRAEERANDATPLGGTALVDSVEENDPIVARGEWSLFGQSFHWNAIGGEQYLIGEGTARRTLVDLTRARLDIVVTLPVAAPPSIESELAGVLARLRVVGLERPSDARLYDPSFGICPLSGATLAIPVPPGGTYQPSWVDSCAVGPDPDPDTAAWLLIVTPVDTSDPAQAELVRAGPSGVRTWVEGMMTVTGVADTGSITVFGHATHYELFEGTDARGRPRLGLGAMLVDGDRRYAAGAFLAPSERARVPALLESLGGLRAL